MHLDTLSQLLDAETFSSFHRQQIISQAAVVIPHLLTFLDDLSDESSASTVLLANLRTARAAELLAEIQAKQAVNPLLAALQQERVENDLNLQAAIIEALKTFGSHVVEPTLDIVRDRLQKDMIPEAIDEAYLIILAQSSMKHQKVFQALADYLEFNPIAAAKALKVYGDIQALPLLADILDTYEWQELEDASFYTGEHEVFESSAEAILALGGALNDVQQQKYDVVKESVQQMQEVNFVEKQQTFFQLGIDIVDNKDIQQVKSLDIEAILHGACQDDHDHGDCGHDHSAEHKSKDSKTLSELDKVHVLDLECVRDILLFAFQTYGESFLAYEVFAELSMASPIDAVDLFGQWAAYHFEVAPGVSTADAYVQAQLGAKQAISADRQAWLDAQSKAHFSLWQIEKNLPKQGILLKDFVTGQQCKVMDADISDIFTEKDIFYGRVVTEFRGMVIICGMHEIMMDEDSAKAVIGDLQDECRVSKITLEHLCDKEKSDLLLNLWADIAESAEDEESLEEEALETA